MSTKPLRVLVLTCSNRPAALGPAVGRWLIDAVTPRAPVARPAHALEGRPATSIRVHPGLGHGIDEAELAEVADFLR